MNSVTEFVTVNLSFDEREFIHRVVEAFLDCRGEMAHRQLLQSLVFLGFHLVFIS